MSAASTSSARRRALRRLGVAAAGLALPRALLAGTAERRLPETRSSVPLAPGAPGAARLGESDIEESSRLHAIRAALQRRPIPSSGETLPCIGMGTWITFDLPPDHPARDQRVEVMRRFLGAGGGLLDSSPMYGHAEELIGDALARVRRSAPGHSSRQSARGSARESNATTSGAPFAASKIWTPIALQGPAQMANTENLWGVRPMDLMQVHNLVDWRAHLPRLGEWKAEGRIRYIGVTTSHGRRHAELAALLEGRDGDALDFVQLTYNARDREAEARLLPLARERGVAVIANRPLQRGALVRDNARRPLPAIAGALGCHSWAQLCLLYAVSHPDITCVIPASGVPAHADENMTVGTLAMPDAATRRELLAAIV